MITRANGCRWLGLLVFRGVFAGECPPETTGYELYSAEVTGAGQTMVLNKPWQDDPYSCITSADSTHVNPRIIERTDPTTGQPCNLTIRTENLCTKNVYMELGYDMPPVTPQCGFTDQPGCWVLNNIEARAGRSPLSCNRCCMEDDGSCWDYIQSPSERGFPQAQVDSMDITAWETKRGGDGIMQRKQYCCLGKLGPNMKEMHREIIKQSEKEKEEYWPVCGVTDRNECWESNWATQNNVGCEMCCYNPHYHPTPWNDAGNNVKVGQNPCFKKGSLKEDHESHYEAWRRCCMNTCDANMSQLMCSIMPFIPMIGLATFLGVLVLCCAFEYTMINQMLCFRSSAMGAETTDAEAEEDLEQPMDNFGMDDDDTVNESDAEEEEKKQVLNASAKMGFLRRG